MTSKKDHNSLPALLDALRLSLREVAEQVGVSQGATETWRAGFYQPQPKARARLVRFVRKHAQDLLKLAGAVEREGKSRGSAKAPNRVLHTQRRAH